MESCFLTLLKMQVMQTYHNQANVSILTGSPAQERSSQVLRAGGQDRQEDAVGWGTTPSVAGTLFCVLKWFHLAAECWQVTPQQGSLGGLSLWQRAEKKRWSGAEGSRPHNCRHKASRTTSLCSGRPQTMLYSECSQWANRTSIRMWERACSYCSS